MAESETRTEGNLITEVAYWRDPVQVFTGVSWLLVGGLFGFFIRMLTHA